MVIAIIGGVALFVWLLGGGITVKDVTLLPLPDQRRRYASVTGFGLIGIAVLLWLFPPPDPNPPSLTLTATASPFPTSTPPPHFTSTPTASASPTSTTAPTPAPNARIIKPLHVFGQTVPTDVETMIEYNNIPQDRYLWIVVRAPSVRPIYPQLQDGIPPLLKDSGTYETTVQIGSPGDSGEPFNVVALLLDEQGHNSFIDYANKCIRDVNECVGIDLRDEIALRDTGVVILDFTTVIRE